MAGPQSIGSVAIGEIAGGDGLLVIVPNATIAVAASAPVLNTVVNAPAAAVTIAANVPTIATGKRIVAPGASVSVSASAPMIATGKQVSQPVASIVVAASAPSLLAGNAIEVVNTISVTASHGEIGSSSIGEFAIGEGELSTAITKSPPLVIIVSNPPLIAAGKSISPTVKSISLITSRPEIISRRRKLRVMAIAS